MDKLVSILIPVFNRENVIAETLRSALDQSYDNLELVVVDNASTDQTWEIIKNIAIVDSRVRAFRNEVNVGPVKNWRRCIEEAKGFYAKILWSDDLISSDFLEKCLPLLDEETGFVYSGVKIFTEEPNRGEPVYFIGKTGHQSSEEFIKRALLNDNVPVSPGCAIFRREDIDKNLLIEIDTKVDSQFSAHAIGNDLLLFLLTANDYKKFGFVAEPLSFFRSHSDSISRSSGDGKLYLHYMLVRAYFTERYRIDMIDQLTLNIFFMLKRFPEHASFGIDGIDDFFYRPVKVRYWRVFFRYLYRLAVTPFSFYRKKCRATKR